MPARSWTAGVLSLLLCGFYASVVSAQLKIRQVDPREFGLDIPSGPVSEGRQAVTTTDESGAPVVAKTHVNVGQHRILLLPDGQLVVRHQRDAPETERPFKPITKPALAERLAAEFPGFKVKQSRRYLYVSNTSDEFALVAGRILDTMFPGVVSYANAQKIETHEPEVPLVALMFRTEAQFQSYQRMPAGVVAYYHTLTNRVVMYEESRLARVKRELAIQQSLATIAHEGAHQILHNIGVQRRLSIWPMWLSEGMAEFFAPTTFGRRLKWKGAGQVNDMRMFELELYLKSRESDQPDGEMLEHTVSAARLTSTGYASAWSLTHYLAKNKRADFNDYVREISRLKPLEAAGETVPPGVIPSNLAFFKEHFGQDLGDLNKRLVLHLKKLPYNDPFAEWPHYVATVAVLQGRKAKRDANIFHTQDMARKWIQEALETVTAEQRDSAQVGVREFRNRVVATQYARTWLGQ